MPVLRATDLRLAYGGAALFDGLDLDLEAGERVGLVGRNGTGKSSLLRVLAGIEPPDAGRIWRADDCAVGLLPQEVPRDLEGTAFDVVSTGLGPLHALLARHRAASRAVAEEATEAALRRLGEVERAIEVHGAWDVERRVEEVLARLDLEPDRPFAELSGGTRRRVLLGRALVNAPTVLLLDEPTNHLDLEAIEWLEAALLRDRRTLLFVTHDRAFLADLATRIVELDRGRLTSYPGSYERYRAVRDAALAAEDRADALFDRRLAEEEAWVRQGIKARRTRNEGRVRALEQLRSEQRARRTRTGTVRMEIVEAERSGRLVIAAEGVSFGYGDAPPVLRDVTTAVLRGDRIGIIGRNGAGKTTLLRLLLGELPPTQGTVRLGTGLAVAYFDQARRALDEDRTVIENVADGNDVVELDGRPRHVIGYLRDFLFTADRCRTPVRALSGGERNRVLLARLFARPSNVLVLDEPTNDLDLETLELLEERLADYAGTLLLVSHDRAFLTQVVTSTLAIEDEGRVVAYAGGYDDWLLQRPSATRPTPASGVSASTPARRGAPALAAAPGRPRRRSRKETQELTALPGRIETLEAEREHLYAQFADPDVARTAGAGMAALQARLRDVEDALAEAYTRWGELEALPG